jgi:hypothetical protein
VGYLFGMDPGQAVEELVAVLLRVGIVYFDVRLLQLPFGFGCAIDEVLQVILDVLEYHILYESIFGIAGVEKVLRWWEGYLNFDNIFAALNYL